MGCRLTVAAMVAAATIGAAPARAAPTAVVVVATAEAPARPAVVTAVVEAALTDAGVEAVHDGGARAVAALAAGAVPAERLDGFRRVDEAAAAGWRKYLEVDASYAASRLAKVRLDAEELLPLAGGLERYADVSLRLGVVLDDLGRGDEAAQAFRLARALDPGREVGLADFSPDAVAAFERAIAAAESPRRSVLVSVNPAEATLEIDGVAVAGRGAERRLELAVGQHVLVGHAAGHVARGLGFAVTAVGEAVAALALDRDAELAALAGAGADTEVRLLGRGRDEASAQLGVDALIRYGELAAVILVASVWRRGAPALIGQRCAIDAAGGPGARCTEAIEIGYEGNATASAAAELVAALVPAGRRFPPTLPADARVARAEAAPGAREGADDGCRLCRSGWVWVGAAALAIGGGALWIFGRDGERTTTVGVDPGEFTLRP